MPSAYKTEVADCDVQDKANIQAYRAHRTKWELWCEIGDPNSLGSQFDSMFWFDAVFHLINETRNTSDTNFAAFSGVLAEALDSGFVAGQAIAIRKLVDGGGDVISLRRLATDIRTQRQVITREAYVCHDGLPYDAEAAERERSDEIMRRRQAGETGAMWMKPAADLSRYAHKVFDELSRVSEHDRRRQDLIYPAIFDQLDTKISTCGATKIKDAANKYLFHAADEASRTKIAATELNLILSELTALHRKLAQIGNFISAKIVGAGPCALGVATAQFDIVERLDRPFVDTTRLEELRDWWDIWATESNRFGYETLTL